jgi:hypothetical protein
VSLQLFRDQLLNNAATYDGFLRDYYLDFVSNSRTR